MGSLRAMHPSVLEAAASSLRAVDTVVTHRDGTRTLERHGRQVGELPPADVSPPALQPETKHSQSPLDTSPPSMGCDGARGALSERTQPQALDAWCASDAPSLEHSSEATGQAANDTQAPQRVNRDLVHEIEVKTSWASCFQLRKILSFVHTAMGFDKARSASAERTQPRALDASCASDAPRLEHSSEPSNQAARDTKVSQRVNRDLAREIEVKTSWANLLDRDAMPTGSRQPDNREVYLVDGAFTANECAALVSAAERHGYGATNYAKSYRGNLRLITSDSSLTDAMWKRLQPFVPSMIEFGGQKWEAIGLNECWRLSKYHPGDRFGRHCDARFVRSSQEMSMFTVNIYMNSNFEGGETRFYPDGHSREPDLTVKPQPGLCLLFRQPPGRSYHHDGEEVRSGQKYLFRSDVMYRVQG